MIWRRSLCERLIAAWIHDCCRTGPTLWEHAGALYRSWCRFAQCCGEEPGSAAAFAAAMERHGFTIDAIPQVSRGRIRWGLRLR